MNMRQLKRAHYARFSPAFAVFGLPVSVHSFAAHTMLAEASHVIDHVAFAEVPAPFYCLKVKDDSIVDQFDTREEALALVLKHAKQKKAKLHVTHKGEPVLFSEEEFA